jgi:sugar lactone lactonase YvrE
MPYRLLLIALAIAALLDGIFAAAKPGMVLIPIVASQEMIWNAVAKQRERIFVAGPRWTGSKGPAVALIDYKGHPQPYPDKAWNEWTTGADPAHAFVSVNALHRDNHGGLWAIDTGTVSFGGNPLPGGAKAVRIGLGNNEIERVYPLGPQAALAGSYIDDIRFHGEHAYLTDAGRPGLLVLDLKSGAVRRVLDGAPSVTAPPDRNIVVAGKVLNGPDGSPLRVNSDPLEVSPDGQFLYFAPLEGPWSKIETRWLDDASVPPDVLASKVQPWADLPPVGGTAMDKEGNLYFSDLATNSFKRRAADGAVTTLIQDDRLHWADAPFIAANHSIWIPVPQLDRVALFNGGKSQIRWPVQLFRLEGAAAARRAD